MFPSATKRLSRIVAIRALHPTIDAISGADALVRLMTASLKMLSGYVSFIGMIDYSSA